MSVAYSKVEVHWIQQGQLGICGKSAYNNLLLRDSQNRIYMDSRRKPGRPVEGSRVSVTSCYRDITLQASLSLVILIIITLETLSAHHQEIKI